MNELAVALEWKIWVIHWIEEKRGREAATDGLLKNWDESGRSDLEDWKER